MANIEHLLDDIRKDKYCQEMRETFCNALIETNKAAEEIESTVKKIKNEITSVNANAEVIDARCGEENLGDFNRKISSQLDTIANKTATKNELDIERTRINNLAKLGEGSTTGDAELIDGRIGADGTTYDNIGSSIRSQISNIEDTMAQINVIHSDLLPVIIKWRKIRIDGRDGTESESDIHRSTVKYSFNTGETVYGSDLTNVEYYWYVYQYTSEGVFEKMLINTQKVFSFIAEEGKKYAFQLWYGGTDFSKISSAQISVTNSTNIK